MNCLDENIGWSFDGVHRSFYMFLGALVVAIISVPWCAVALPLIIVWSFYIVRMAAAAIK